LLQTLSKADFCFSEFRLHYMYLYTQRKGSADVETLVGGCQESGGDLHASKEDPDKPYL